MKKLDKLLVRSFIPPFIVTFFIALFVFVMQTLWLYIDEIAGKGVGFFLLVELVGYLSVSMIPISLPVAVLISSVMILGNLAESYELSSIKSAGISLWRVMRPMMVITSLIGVFSFFCSNYFIPVSNLKFKSRLYDIRQQKPALSLEESVFNQDFQGFSIRIGDKLPNNRSIRNVLVYDNADAAQGRLSMVAADSGEMSGSTDNKFFVMKLYNGSQLNEPKPTVKNGRRNYPMMRSTFEEWTKVFDLDQFELDRTDENLFKSHHSMLSNRQLLIAVDSIDREVNEKYLRLGESTNHNYFFWEKEYLKKRREENKRASEVERQRRDSIKNLQLLDSGRVEQPSNQAVKDSLEAAGIKPPTKPLGSDSMITSLQRQPGGGGTAPKIGPARQQAPIVAKKHPLEKALQQPNAGKLKPGDYFLDSFGPQDRIGLVQKATQEARSVEDQAKNTLRSLGKTLESRVKHVFEYHSKFSMAAACLIFLFVGAPMGAIVRKGGFGWPLLISIVFFMVFIVIGIFSKNIAERAVIHAVAAAWMNCLVVFPMGLVLTYLAMRDKSLLR